MSQIYTGNAQLDGENNRQWIVGHFMPQDSIHRSDDVEIKWATLKSGERRETWTTAEKRTTIALLVSGKVTLEFRGQKCPLSHQGDYVMWGVGIDHRWEAAEDSAIITVRWPSIPT